MSSQDYISIAIPVFNETAGLMQLLNKTFSLPLHKELIIINDGSTNTDTNQILKTFETNYRNVRILTNAKNLGKSASIQRALQIAKGNIFVVLDGDSELNPNDIIRLYTALKKENARFVNGIRIQKIKQNFYSFPQIVTHVAKILFGHLLHLFYGIHVKDSLSGYKMFYRNDFNSYQFSTKRFGLESDLLIAAIRNNQKLIEINVDYYPRTYKQGKKIRMIDGLEILCCILSHKVLPFSQFLISFRVILVGFLLCFFTFFMYTLHANSSSTSDSLPNNFTAVNVLYNHRLDITNFNQYFQKRHQKSVEVANNKGVYYAKTPVINGILSVPFFYLFDTHYNMRQVSALNFSQKDYETYYQSVGKYYASFLTSISVFFMFLTLYMFFKKLTFAIWGTLAYGFASMVYSTASQGNWQHAPSLLLITFSFYLFFNFLQGHRKNYLLFIAMLLAIASLIRISNIFFYLAIFCVLIIDKNQRKSVIVPTIFFVLIIGLWELITILIGIPGGYNTEIVRSFHAFNPFYTFRVILSLLISPNVGLFIFCPLSIFSFLGIYKLITLLKNHTNDLRSPTFLFLMMTICSFTLIFLFNSFWWAWEGGFSWGPRLLTEAVPSLVFLGVYFFSTIQRKRIMTCLFISLFFYSFLVHLTGVYADDNDWHSKYYKDGVDRMTMAWQTNPTILYYYIIKRKIFFIQELLRTDQGLAVQKSYYKIDIFHFKWSKLDTRTEYL